MLSVRDASGKAGKFCSCCLKDKETGEAVMKRLTAGHVPLDESRGSEGWATAVVMVTAAALLSVGLVMLSRRQQPQLQA